MSQANGISSCRGCVLRRFGLWVSVVLLCAPELDFSHTESFRTASDYETRRSLKIGYWRTLQRNNGNFVLKNSQGALRRGRKIRSARAVSMADHWWIWRDLIDLSKLAAHRSIRPKQDRQNSIHQPYLHPNFAWPAPLHARPGKPEYTQAIRTTKAPCYRQISETEASEPGRTESRGAAGLYSRNLKKNPRL